MTFKSVLMIAAMGFTSIINQRAFSKDTLTFASRPFYGWALQVEASKHHAFVGAGNSLIVFNIQDPARPILISTLDFDGFASPLQIEGDTLFLTAGGKFHLLNIADPSAPRITHTLLVDASSLSRRDSLYFFAAGDLRIFKLTNSGEFIQVGSYRGFGEINRVAVQGQIAVIGTDERIHSEGRLQLLDITDISTPRLLWDEFGYHSDKIAIVDSLAFVARVGHIAIYKINADSLEKIFQTSNLTAGNFFIMENTLYAAAGERGVEIYDFSNPHDLKTIGTFATIGSVQDIFIQEGLAYVADLSGGLQIFDLSDIGNPRLLGHFDRSTSMVEFEVRDKNLFSRTVVPDKSSVYSAQVFQIFDLQDLLLPANISNTNLSWPTTDMFIKDHRAYFAISSVADGSGIWVYDITNARAPRKIDLIPSLGNNEAVFIRDNLLFLALQGLRIFDLSSHKLIAEFSVPGTSTDGLFVMDGLAFFWGFSQLYILDVSQLPQLNLLNEIKISNIYNIAISPDTIAFIARRYDGLDILDLRQPQSPINLAQYKDDDQVNDLYLSGKLVFLAGDKFCRVLEVSTPSQPARLAQYEATIAATQVSYLESQNLVYFSGFGLGMLILKFERESAGVHDPAANPVKSFQLYQNHPNPFNTSTTIRYALPRPEHVTLKVYDLMGKEVATLVRGKKAAGEYQIHWDAGDLPGGLYLYRLQAGAYVATKKLVLLK